MQVPEYFWVEKMLKLLQGYHSFLLSFFCRSRWKIISIYILWYSQLSLNRQLYKTTTLLEWTPTVSPCPGGGGDSEYERGGDACQKFWIKPLKETNLGVAQAFFDP